MFAIGDKEWAGTSKLVEEMGELQQVLGKLMGSRGNEKHWSGDLREMLIEEIADVYAAIKFFETKNFNNSVRRAISIRSVEKFATFMKWDKDDPET